MEWPEITKDTPIEEVKRIHQQIWDYVIEQGYKPNVPYVAKCAACAYNEAHFENCRDCPIVWPNDVCYGKAGLFDMWEKEYGQEKTELARQIRDLPWKFEQRSDS